MSRPNLHMFRGIFGLLGKTKVKAYTKLTVVMCCKIFDRKSLSPSSGNFRRHRHCSSPVEKIRNVEKKNLFSRTPCKHVAQQRP